MTYTTKTEGFEYEARRVAVIGGGAAGMMAAVTSAEVRGWREGALARMP